MALQTIAVIFGVSYYFKQEIAPLPAAQADAVNFARCLKNWGIAETDIYLFLNSDAKKEVIDHLFQSLADRQEDFKLIFYFCGHGYRLSTSDPESYLFFYDSYLQDGTFYNSISLDLIIKRVNKLKAVECYYIIDACYLRITNLQHPSYFDEINNQKQKDRSVFCLLSSGIKESFESDQGCYGYFTEALLSGLCRIRESGLSTAELVGHIKKQMASQGLPRPEYSSIGTQEISFLSQPEKSVILKDSVYRTSFIAKIQDALVQNRGKILCLVGNAGSGKSTLCRHLVSEKLKSLYLKIPLQMPESFDPVVYMSEAILSELGISLQTLKSPEEILLVLDECFPYHLVIIDQIERLNPKQLDALFEMIVELKTRFIVTSTQSLQNLIDEKFQGYLHDLEVPPFSSVEGQQLIELANPDSTVKESEMIFLVSQGSPLKMRRVANFLAKPIPFIAPELERELKRAITALYSCGCYFNEHLFASTFQLKETTLHFLEHVGLILKSEAGNIPHDLLSEIVEAEKLLPLPQETLKYWYAQHEDLPDHVQAARHLIFAVKDYGYQPEAERYLNMAFQTLYSHGREFEGCFVDGVNIYKHLPTLTETSLLVAEVLTEWGEFDLAQQLLKIPAPNELFTQAQLCIAQKFWRTGLLKESIAICSQLMPHIKEPLQLMKCSFFRGTAYFLKGDWPEAYCDFEFVHNHAEEKHYVARAYCMMGTILGLRGTDSQRGREFLERGTRLLAMLKDFSGLWMGYNNLGEMFWKCGEYRSSLSYLEKALENANLIKMDAPRLETLRNLLQLHLRMSGPFSRQVTDLLVTIERSAWRNVEYFEKAQMLNTLATAHLFRRNALQALPLLKAVFNLTLGNQEYHVYTLSNLALLFKLWGKDDKAEVYLAKALEIAEKSGNRLAILQIKNDFTICFKDNYPVEME